MKGTQASRVRFGRFELDLRAGELHGNGESVLLPEQVFQVLHVLLDRRGKLVTRDELKKKLWPNDTVVEFEHGINNTIKRLRHTLEDSAEDPRYIETIPRRGYRLMVPVEWLSESAAEASSADSVESSDSNAEAAGKAKLKVGRLTGSAISHYRVLEVIGGGGMGLVYRAEDLKLNRAVALKFLPEEVGDDAKARERFEREAHAASALDHPNICTIYDFDNYEGHPFIAMQLLQGKTLREHIADGRFRLNQPEGLEIAIQIAAGLEAAHEKGIIHRDIKPANIFITEKNVAKILDFGVAKVLQVSEQQESAAAGASASAADAPQGVSIKPATTNLTRTGLKLGTAGYMSPEQVRGEPLDARTDIFSFGLVLYEMATGERAFTGQTEAILHHAILNHDPVPVRDLNSGLPAKLAATIDKALEKDRERRYQNAAEMHADLEKVTGTKRSSDRRLWKWVGATALLIAVAVGGWFYWRSHNTIKLTAGDTIVLADFTNSTTDPAFGGALNAALLVELQQSPFLNVLSADKVRGALQAMDRSPTDLLNYETARAVCRQTGSAAVVAGSIADVGNRYRIGLKAVNCGNGLTLATTEPEMKLRNEVVKTLGEAGNQLRLQVGEPSSSVKEFCKPLNEATSSSVEALEAYSRAANLAAQQGYAAAIPYYKRALELDPNFVQPLFSLAAQETMATGRESYTKKAFDLRDRLTQRDRFWIEGAYYSASNGEIEKAVQSYMQWAQSYPYDFTPCNNLGVLFRELGQYEMSASQAREALRMSPNSYYPVYNLMRADIAMNRLDDSKAVFDQARERKLDAGDLRELRYWLAFLERDEAAMQEQVAWAMGKPLYEDRLLNEQSDTEAFYGRLGKAREFSQRAVDSAKHAGNNETAAEWMAYQAWREAEVGNALKARKAAAEALALSGGINVTILSAVGLAIAGDAKQAEEVADRVNQRRPLDTLVQSYVLPSIRAALELHNGNARRAVEILVTAAPYELSSEGNLLPIYIRGQAYLKLRDGQRAAMEFQKLLDHPGIVPNFVTGALAHLQLARAHAKMGDKAAARKSYQDFLTLWKDADPDIPIYKQAKAEYARLR